MVELEQTVLDGESAQLALKNKMNKFFKKIHAQFFGKNRNYRYFVFIAWLVIWSNVFYIDLWDFFWTLIFAIIPSFLITLYIVDKPFNRYVCRVRRRWQADQRKEQLKQKKKEKEFQKSIKEISEAIPHLIFSPMIPYITRLPILDNLYKNSLYHHKNRQLLKFSELIEVGKRNRIIVKKVDIDQYFVTFDIKLPKNLTSKKAEAKINRAMKKYFGIIPSGTLIRLKRTTGRVCIPTELLRKDPY